MPKEKREWRYVPKYDLDDEAIETIKRLRRVGTSYAKIAVAVGLPEWSHRTIARVCEKYADEIRMPESAASERFKTKYHFDDATLGVIKRLHQSGMSYAKIAVAIGLSKSAYRTIARVCEQFSRE